MGSFFSSIPKVVVGPLVVILMILYFIYDDPPKTVCDLQMDIFKKETQNYIYGYAKKAVKFSPEYQKQLALCHQQNSPGACYDWMEGIKKTLHFSHNIPDECSAEKQGFVRDLKQMTGSEDKLGPYKKWMSISLYTFSQISWNDSNVVRQGLYNWLDEEDIAVFCHLRREYLRLYGKESFTQLQNSFHGQLIKLKNKTAKEAWDRSILSYRCPN